MPETKNPGNSYFQRAREQAKSLVQDRRKLSGLISDTKAKLKDDNFENSKVYKLVDKLKVMMRLVRAYTKGAYSEIPWKSLVTLVAGILYYLNPFDLIPDFIPITGLLDDFTVIMLIANAFRKDLDTFIQWEQGQE